ncbi:hypothetical protein [Alicyclobacillus sp. SO9]|uniref:hypothetical protein n=1 Tax=Alicyclobacillus sp. SO9 TaxID=2665646 RepID=UPI0018E7D8B3|nr:hypothetical protein [Alicyclobacillus sp. SO9]QQE80854.1 hypothetical protein GI364_11000 [Alicyclobacillus sp. SO9]
MAPLLKDRLLSLVSLAHDAIPSNLGAVAQGTGFTQVPRFDCNAPWRVESPSSGKFAGRQAGPVQH